MGSPDPAQVRTTDSSGAQKTDSPVDMGHCSTLLSDPAQAKLLTCGGTAPQDALAHPVNPEAPLKPMALQATLADPLVKPSLQTGAQPLASDRNISKRPASCGKAGAPLGAIKRSSPFVKAGWPLNPQNTTESPLWVRQASSTSSNLHPSINADLLARARQVL